MKTRIRQLANGSWIIEGRYLLSPRWFGVRVAGISTRGSIESGYNSLPYISTEPIGGNHYPMTWHSTKDGAEQMLKDVLALLGK